MTTKPLMRNIAKGLVGTSVLGLLSLGLVTGAAAQRGHMMMDDDGDEQVTRMRGGPGMMGAAAMGQRVGARYDCGYGQGYGMMGPGMGMMGRGMMGPGMMGGYGQGYGMMGPGMGMMGRGMMGSGMMGPGMMGGYGQGSGMMGPGMMGGYGQGSGMMGPGMMGPGGYGYGMGPDLSDEQQEQIRNIQRETRREQLKLMAQMQRQQADLFELRAQEDPDEDAIGEAYEKLQETRRKMMKNRYHAHERMEDVLSEE